MSTGTIRLDGGVREETARIASETGPTLNAEKGFPFPVKLEIAHKTAFGMSSDEFEAACQEAVDVPTIDYVTRIDEESTMITKTYVDGRAEPVLV